MQQQVGRELPQLEEEELLEQLLEELEEKELRSERQELTELQDEELRELHQQELSPRPKWRGLLDQEDTRDRGL